MLHDITCMWNLTNNINKCINRCKMETDSDIESKFMVTKGVKEGGRDKLGVYKVKKQKQKTRGMQTPTDTNYYV